MAYQLGLPILIFRQKGVIDDGILERGVVGLYMPEFDLEISIMCQQKKLTAVWPWRHAAWRTVTSNKSERHRGGQDPRFAVSYSKEVASTALSDIRRHSCC